MWSFGKFSLNFFVNLNVSFDFVDLGTHFVICEQQLLSLLGLMIQLSGQLVILQDGESCCGLQLLIIESQQIGFGFFDFVLHFFP